MYREITVDRSILYIEQHHVDTFVNLAEKYEAFNEIVNEAAVNKKDAWIIAFNIWLLLLPDNSNIIHSAEKTLYYSTNFVLLNAFQKNAYFNQLKMRQIRPEPLYYILSLKLAAGLNSWLFYVKEKNNLTYMAERNKHRVYFDSHNGPSEEVQSFLEDQSKFVKAAVKELNSSDSFDKMIKDCIDDAMNLYNSHYVNEPSPQ
ncbi:MAG: hypothetical protein GX072_05420 [Lysinibacillus sp.]|nr:hypothetical protein [Lysinibacillus sp.]